jgi:hypothetical protein
MSCFFVFNMEVSELLMNQQRLERQIPESKTSASMQLVKGWLLSVEHHQKLSRLFKKFVDI